MWSFFSVAVVCGLVVWLVERVPHQVLRLRQTAAASDEATLSPSAPTPDPIPPQLMQIAMMESEGWARESAIKTMYELYDQCRDWNVVAAQWRPFDFSNMDVS